MSKYGSYVGKIQLNVGGFNKELSPKVGDSRELLKIISGAQEDRAKMFDDFAPFITKLIARDIPPNNVEEKNELDMFVDSNLLELFNEIMVVFKLTTREELEKAKKESLQVLGKRKAE